ncbi:hypothetical protein BT93_J0331 [Corymbia citriodora subsp. variegata]|nr:hypothetical protein BT93_J0331 [Corymbia citriodora subsp. variegata]
MDFEFDSVGVAITRELEGRVVELVRKTLNQCFFPSFFCGCLIVNSWVIDFTRCEISNNLWKAELALDNLEVQ